MMMMLLLLPQQQAEPAACNSPNHPGRPAPQVRPQLAWSHRQKVMIVLLKHPADYCIHCLGAAQLVVPKWHCFAPNTEAAEVPPKSFAFAVYAVPLCLVEDAPKQVGPLGA
jgi:hypothetical protein